MEPFNIKIITQDQPIVFTVIPTDKGYYKIIYYAAILTAIMQQSAGKWILINKDEIEAGDLPYYISGTADDRQEILLDQDFISQAGLAIEMELKTQSDTEVN